MKFSGNGEIEDEDRSIGAELPAAAGRFDDAVAMLEAAGAWWSALPPAHALMLAPPIPMMEPIHRFDAR